MNEKKDLAVEEARRFAPDLYEFYRGYIKGVLDALTDSNLEDTHPGLDIVIDHVVAALICDVKRRVEERLKS